MKNLTLKSHLFVTTFLLALGANAAPIVFNGIDVNANSTDPRPNSIGAAASFDAAAGVLGTVNLIDFESAPVGGFGILPVAPGVTLTASQTIANTPQGTPESVYGYNTTSGGSRFLSLFGGDITFNFGTPVRAFGAYFSGVQFSGGTITFSDGSSQTINIPNPGAGVQFLGFTDANQLIAAVTVHAFTDIIGMDDVRFVTVPEPAAGTLVALGLCGLLLNRRKLWRA